MRELLSQNLQVLIDEAGRDFASKLLDGFSCPLDPDIEQFVREKAIDFSDRGIAKTHLVFLGEPDFRFVGMYALAPKILSLPGEGLSQTTRKRLERFGRHDTQSDTYTIPTILLAQFSKNYAFGLNKEVEGCELLEVACNKIRSLQSEMGGGLVFAECKDTPKLISFYEDNNFKRFTADQPGEDELVKLIKFL